MDLIFSLPRSLLVALVCTSFFVLSAGTAGRRVKPGETGFFLPTLWRERKSQTGRPTSNPFRWGTLGRGGSSTGGGVISPPPSGPPRGPPVSSLGAEEEAAESEGKMSQEEATLILGEQKLSTQDLPQGLRDGVKEGMLSADQLKQWMRMRRLPLLGGLLAGMPAVFMRTLADPLFWYKFWVQQAIGNGMALAAELSTRGRNFWRDFDQVSGHLLPGLIVEGAFVWTLAERLKLPAPALRKAAGQSGVAKLLQTLAKTSAGQSVKNYLSWSSTLPSHFFAAGSFPYSSRALSVANTGIQYAVIGFASGVLGAAISQTIARLRGIDSSRPPPPTPVSAILGWSSFMALNSNARFHMCEGIEMFFRKSSLIGPALSRSLIVGVRLLNNYIGGLAFIWHHRILGLHKEAEGEEQEEESGPLLVGEEQEQPVG